MHNFFTKTLFQKRFMLMWWFIGVTAITVLTVAFYHSFRETNLDQIYKGLPKSVQALTGDVNSLKTVDGYVRQQVFALRLPLILIILAISLLVGLTAGDEQKGLLETQLSLPVSRTSLLLQKLAAAAVILVVASIGAIVGIVITLALLHESYSLAHVFEYTFNCLVLCLVYGLVPFMLAAVTGRRGLALGIGSGFAFLSYLVNTMAQSVSALKAIDKLTFFHYYHNNPFSLGNCSVLLVSAVILIVISILGFNRRDIRAN